MATDLTTVPDERKLRTGYNATGSDYALGLALTGSYGACTVPTAKTDPIVGVTRAIMKAGYQGSLATSGLELVLAGTGGFSKGQRLMPEANTGKAIPWSAAAGANATILGIAQSDAAEGALGLCELGVGAMGQGA